MPFWTWSTTTKLHNIYILHTCYTTPGYHSFVIRVLFFLADGILGACNTLSVESVMAFNLSNRNGMLPWTDDSEPKRSNKSHRYCYKVLIWGHPHLCNHRHPLLFHLSIISVSWLPHAETTTYKYMNVTLPKGTCSLRSVLQFPTCLFGTTR